jgi:hypothetical protein
MRRSLVACCKERVGADLFGALCVLAAHNSCYCLAACDFAFVQYARYQKEDEFVIAKSG